MFLPKRHLLAILQPNPVRQSVRVLSDPPESAVFDFGDFEVDSFGTLVVGILDYDADNAGRKEVADCLGGEYGAAPVGESVLSDWSEGTWHGGEGRRRRNGDGQWMKDWSGRRDILAITRGRRRSFDSQVGKRDDSHVVISMFILPGRQPLGDFAHE